MRREKSIDLLYDTEKLDVKDVKRTIQKFAAYLDKFNHDFKYNYKYLPSHIDDFMNTVNSLSDFELSIRKIKKNIIDDNSTNGLLSKIMLSKNNTKFVITFNESISLITESGTEEGLVQEINNTLTVDSIKAILSGKKNYINMDLTYLSKNDSFESNYYELNPSEVIENIIEFIDSCNTEIEKGV